MNKEQAKQELERLKEISKRFLEQNNFREFKNIVTDKSERIMIGKECFYLSPKVHQALDIAIESLEHQVNEKDEIKLVCPKCKREWTKPIGEFCSSCGTEMVVEPYERKE